MTIHWSDEASLDLVRLHYFLSEKSERAADAAIRLIVVGALTLNSYGRRGQIVEKYLPREVRRLIVADYEVRYELHGEDAFIVAVFHMREER